MNNYERLLTGGSASPLTNEERVVVDHARANIDAAIKYLHNLGRELHAKHEDSPSHWMAVQYIKHGLESVVRKLAPVAAGDADNTQPEPQKMSIPYKPLTLPQFRKAAKVRRVGKSWVVTGPESDGNVRAITVSGVEQKRAVHAAYLHFGFKKTCPIPTWASRAVDGAGPAA